MYIWVRLRLDKKKNKFRRNVILRQIRLMGKEQ